MKVIAIGNDHCGTELKERIVKKFASNYKFIDCGTNSNDSVDYPDYSKKVCDLILENKADLGVLICGTGIGMSISANRRKRIRAALCHHSLEAKLTREHNNANVLCLGSKMIGDEVAYDCLDAFMNTEFSGGRHSKRVEKIEEL